MTIYSNNYKTFFAVLAMFAGCAANAQEPDIRNKTIIVTHNNHFPHYIYTTADGRVFYNTGGDKVGLEFVIGKMHRYATSFENVKCDWETMATLSGQTLTLSLTSQICIASGKGPITTAAGPGKPQKSNGYTHTFEFNGDSCTANDQYSKPPSKFTIGCKVVPGRQLP